MKLRAMALLLGGVSLAVFSLPAAAQSIEATVGGGTNFNGLSDFTPGGLPPVVAGNVSGSGSNSFDLNVGSIVNAIVDPILADIDRQAYRQQFDTSVDQNFTLPPNRGGTVVNSVDLGGGLVSAQSRPPTIPPFQRRRIVVDDATSSTVRFGSQLVNLDAVALDGALQHVVRGTVAGNAGQSAINLDLTAGTIAATNADTANLSVQATTGSDVFSSYLTDSLYFIFGDDIIEVNRFGIIVAGSTSDANFDVSNNTIQPFSGVNAFATDVSVDPGLSGSDVTVATGGLQVVDDAFVVSSVHGLTAGVRSVADGNSQLFGKSTFNILNNSVTPTVVVNDLQRTVAGDLDNAALDGIVGAGGQVAASLTDRVSVSAEFDYGAIGLFLNSDGVDADSLGDGNVAVSGNAVNASTIVNRSALTIDPTDGLSVPVEDTVMQRVAAPGFSFSADASLGLATSTLFGGARFGVRVEDADIFGSTITVSDNRAGADLVVNEQTLILGVAAAVQAVLDFEGNDPVDLALLLNAANVSGAISLDLDFTSVSQLGNMDGGMSVQARSAGTSAFVFGFDDLSSSTVSVLGNEFGTSLTVGQVDIAIAPLNGAVTPLDTSTFDITQTYTENGLTATSLLRRSFLGLYDEGLTGGTAIVGGAAADDVTLTVADNILTSDLTLHDFELDVLRLDNIADNGVDLFALELTQLATGTSTASSSIGVLNALNEAGRAGALGISRSFAGGVGGTGADVSIGIARNTLVARAFGGRESVRFRSVGGFNQSLFAAGGPTRTIETVTLFSNITQFSLGFDRVTGNIGSTDGAVNLGISDNRLLAQTIGNEFLFQLDELTGPVGALGRIDLGADTLTNTSFVRSLIQNITVGIDASGNIGGAEQEVTLAVTDLELGATAISSRRAITLGALSGGTFAGNFQALGGGGVQRTSLSTVGAEIGLHFNLASGRPVDIGLIDANGDIGDADTPVNVTLSDVNVFADASSAVFEGTVQSLGTLSGTLNLSSDQRPANSTIRANVSSLTIGASGNPTNLNGLNLVLNDVTAGASASATETSHRVERISTLSGNAILGADQSTSNVTVSAVLGADARPVLVGSALDAAAGDGLTTIVQSTSLSATASGNLLSSIVNDIGHAVTGSIALVGTQANTGGGISANVANAQIGVQGTAGSLSIIRGSGISATATGNSATGSIGN
ncbi:MAG: beta strand repeat-containing protein [Alphaproteobacteria bacterium]